MDSVGNDPIRHSRGLSSEIFITCISHIRLSEGVTCETKSTNQTVPTLSINIINKSANVSLFRCLK